MRFAYTIAYVGHVAASLDFFERAFGHGAAACASAVQAGAELCTAMG